MNKTKNVKNNNRDKSNKRKNKGPGRKSKNPGFVKTSIPVSMGYKSKVDDVTSGVSRIKKREYLMDVTPNSSRFKRCEEGNGIVTALAEIAGNIGLTSSFPWISTLAPGFENFVFKTCNFLFKPSAPTTTPGSISLVPSYDSSKEFGTTKEELLNNVGTVRGPVWTESTCKLDPRKLNAAFKSHKIRDGPLADGEDIKTTDPFKLGVYLDKGAVDANTSLGELWVDYDVELKIPKTQSASKFGQSEKIYFAGSVDPIRTELGKGNQYKYVLSSTSDYYIINFYSTATNTKFVVNTNTNVPGASLTWDVSTQVVNIHITSGNVQIDSQTVATSNTLQSTSFVSADVTSVLKLVVPKANAGYFILDFLFVDDTVAPSMKEIRSKWAESKLLQKTIDMVNMVVKEKEKEKEKKILECHGMLL